jgi:hypothetical protein
MRDNIRSVPKRPMLRRDELRRKLPKAPPIPSPLEKEASVSVSPIALAMVHDEECFTTLLYEQVCKTIQSDSAVDSVSDWENESLLLEMDRLFGNVPDINKDGVCAIHALKAAVPRGSFNFFTEVNCFRHTVNLLNGINSDYDFFGGLIPHHIVWAIWELKQLYPEYSLSEEPAKFLGACFHRMGWLILPEELSEYQEVLDYFNHNNALKEKIESVYRSNPTADIDQLDEDDIIEMHILKLQSSTAYMTHRKKAYQDMLLKVK